MKESEGAGSGPRRAWVIPRTDFGAGGLALVRLHHPLLSEFSSGVLSSEGLTLGPDVEAPRPLPGSADRGKQKLFLLRLLGLASFLKSQGLGIAPRDLARIGSQPGKAERPALGAPPRPEWQGASPALVVSAVALRFAGVTLAEEEPIALRRGIEKALERRIDPEMAEIAISGLRSEDADKRPESLLAGLAARIELMAGGIGPDLLGLVYPSALLFDESLGRARPASATGPASLFLSRGALRREAGERSFFELSSGSSLEEGSSLERAALVLRGDPLGETFAEWARDGSGTSPAPGPPVALLARDADRWDPRSRQAWAERLPGARNALRFETRLRPASPWERRDAIQIHLGTAEVSALLWLPFPSVSSAVSSWESVARGSAGDAARFLVAARRLAAEFDPVRPTSRAHRAVILASRRGAEPAIEAAALLVDGFSREEVAAVAGLDLDEAVAAVERGLATGRLIQDPDADAEGRFRFASEVDRARAVTKLSKGARTDAISRLEKLSIEPCRWIPAALARGEDRDLEAGRELFAKSLENPDRESAISLLRHAGSSASSRLVAPLEAFLVYCQAGTNEEVARAATLLVPGEAGQGALAERLSAARRLVRLGHVNEALGLIDIDESATSAEVLARVRVLLEAHRDEEAGRLLASSPCEPPENLGASDRLQHALLSAEWNGRRQDYPAAAAGLKRVSRLLDAVDSSEVAWQAASTAGCLASDLGHTEDAIAYFRRARQEARTDRARGDSAVDLAVVAMHAGRFSDALEELETALALFSSEGNQDRYVSTLANRAELSMLTGDFAAARSDLTRVLAHDRAAGREHQVLFALPALQKLALLDGDLAGAAEWFRQAEPLVDKFALHPARREALVLEGARLLQAGVPVEALERLSQAGLVPDNRMMNEPLRTRLIASASLDAGLPVPAPAVSLEEALLLRAEALLLSGGTLTLEARRELEARLGRGAEAAFVAWRLMEWLGRFPAAFEGASSEYLFDLGSRAAARAGLAGAATRFQEARPKTSGSFRILTLSPRGNEFVAEDPAIRKLLALIARIAPTSLSVLILGESGTGKELVAREVHRLSGRRGRFVPLNVAALTGSLVESELFGHTRGSFTGAERDRIGLIEESTGGTLFLDEIGDLPLSTQAKLLRVLQEREVSRVGENRVRRVDLRVVAATHRDLSAMVGEGTFRFDLLQRLKGFEAVLPPLRARPRDLEALIARSLGDGSTLSPEARRLLLAHSWPGNVRELLSVLESARALASPARRIEVSHFPFLEKPREKEAEGPITYKMAVDDARKKIIQDALVACHGNRTHAAKRLGLSRQSLLYEMKKFGL